MATINIDAKCDLNKPVVVRHLDGMVFSQDVKANMIRVSVFRNREPVDLSGGSVSANIIRADGATVVQTGTIEGNVCSVVLPSSAYAVPGQIAIFVKHSTSVGPTTSTIAAITGYVYKSTTDTIVDPGSVVPNVNQLLAMIEDCEEATEACIAATAAAPVVDDTAGAGDTNKVWSADKSAGEVQSLMTEINSKAYKTVTDALQIGKAPVIIDSAEGNPIVLTDGADGLPIEGMKIHLSPKQNLNGQDAPYPPGGGANKFNSNTATNGYIKTDGTMNAQTASKEVTSDYIPLGAETKLSAGYYGYSSGEEGWVAIGWFDSNQDFIKRDAMVLDSYTFTIPSGAVYARVSVRTFDHGAQSCFASFGTVTSFSPYSNICPINGWTGVNVWRTGKNLIDDSKKSKSGSNIYIGTETANTPGIILPPGTYTVSFVITENLQRNLYAKDADTGENITGFPSYQAYSTSPAVVTFTLTKHTRIILWTYNTSYTSASDVVSVMLNVGSTASPYTEYTGESYPVTFPDGQTVYGGHSNPVTGILTAEYKKIIADGTNVKVTGGYGSAGSEWLPAIVLSTADKGVPGYAEGNLYASYLAYNQGSVVQTTENTICMASSGGIIALHIGTMQGTDGTHGYSSADDLKSAVNAYLAEHNLEIVYKLATPIEIPLDTITVQTLIGDNTIWSDANGTIELDYRADTKLFIAKNKQDIRATIAPVEDGTTASKAYSAGKFFYHDGQFCKAKTSIASGATFTLNTNYEITTVADELFALN